MPQFIGNFSVGSFEIIEAGWFVESATRCGSQLFEIAFALLQGSESQAQIVNAKLVEFHS
jgi:hypothetical protein